MTLWCAAVVSLWPVTQVNGRRLVGLSHMEVVSVLRELPRDVRLVCARAWQTDSPPTPDDSGPASTVSTGHTASPGQSQSHGQSQAVTVTQTDSQAVTQRVPGIHSHTDSPRQ